MHNSQYMNLSPDKQVHMERLDNLLTRTQQISKHLKSKLNHINQSNLKINQNIDSMKPLFYNSQIQSQLNVNLNNDLIQNKDKKINKDPSMSILTNQETIKKFNNSNSKKLLIANEKQIFQQQPNIILNIEEKNSNYQQSKYNKPNDNRVYRTGFVKKQKQFGQLASQLKFPLLGDSGISSRKAFQEKSSEILQQKSIQNNEYATFNKNVKIQSKQRPRQNEIMLKNQTKSYQKIQKSQQKRVKMLFVKAKNEMSGLSLNPKNQSHQVIEKDKNIQICKSSNIHKSEQSKHQQSSFKDQDIYGTFQQQDSLESYQNISVMPKISQQLIQDSFVFIPFNKLYRSPILQIQDNNSVVLAKYSKISTDYPKTGKIANGTKYKIGKNHIFTDQEKMINYLIQNCESPIRTIGIIGGPKTLKKKIHLQIIKKSMNEIQNYMQDYLNQKSRQNQFSKFRLQILHNYHLLQNQKQAKIHQQFFINKKIDKKQFSKENIKNKFNKILQSISFIMKNEEVNQNSYHNVRITKIIMEAFDQNEQKLLKQSQSSCSDKYLCYNLFIISTNRFEIPLIEAMNINQIIWCINPLIKYYVETQHTLEFLKQFNKNKEKKIIV